MTITAPFSSLSSSNRKCILGDIIKTTLSKARENNKVNCAKTMVQSLILKFREMKDDQNDAVNRSSVEFHTLKELAKR